MFLTRVYIFAIFTQFPRPLWFSALQIKSLSSGVSLSLQDYLDVIREPMDLSKIGKKLRNGHYVIPNDIIRDIRLIFSNAKTYNTKGTMVSPSLHVPL